MHATIAGLTPSSSPHQLQTRQPSAAAHAWAQAASESAVVAATSLGPRSRVFSTREKVLQMLSAVPGVKVSPTLRPAGPGQGGVAKGGAGYLLAAAAAAAAGRQGDHRWHAGPTPAQRLTIILAARQRQQSQKEGGRHPGRRPVPPTRHACSNCERRQGAEAMEAESAWRHARGGMGEGAVPLCGHTFGPG